MEELFITLSGFVGEHWAVFICFAVVALCSLAQAVMPAPTETSSAFYRLLYTLTEKAALNVMKALNAARHK